MKNHFFTPSSTIILFFSLFAILSIMSCQKEKITELAKVEKVEVPAANFSVQKTILIHFFRTEIEGLHEDEVNVLFEQRMSMLSEKDQNNIVDIVEKSLSQETSSTATASTRSSTATTLSAGISGDGFGQGIAATDEFIFVGAPNEQKVYVYIRSGSTYTLHQEITPSGDSDDFGYHIAVSDASLAISAPDFGQPFGRPGQVFIFKREGSNWVQTNILTGPAGEFNFGGDGVAMEGTTLAITSRGSGFPSPGGTISVYKIKEGDVFPNGTIFRPTFDWFAIDINEKGNRIAGTGSVGNFLGNVRASVFVQSGSNWVLEGDLFVPSPFPFANALPRDVAISGDLGNLVLSALIPGNKQWYFKNSPTNGWELIQELNHPGGAPFTNRWVDINNKKIVVGAASNNNFIPEAVHVFEQDGPTSWANTETLVPEDNGVDVIMWSIALNKNTIIAGCPGGGFIPPFPAGNAYVFE